MINRSSFAIGRKKKAVLAKNVLDDGFDASPALADNEIYMHGYRYLYSIGAK